MKPLLVMLITMTVLSMANPTNAFDHQVGELLKHLEELRSAGIDVKPLVKMLDEAVKLYMEGDESKALAILKKVRSKVEELSRVAPSIRLRNQVVKALEIGALASIPVVTYFLLPRVYLALWYRSRRNWLVESGEKR